MSVPGRRRTATTRTAPRSAATSAMYFNRDASITVSERLRPGSQPSSLRERLVLPLRAACVRGARRLVVRPRGLRRPGRAAYPLLPSAAAPPGFLLPPCLLRFPLPLISASLRQRASSASFRRSASSASFCRWLRPRPASLHLLFRRVPAPLRAASLPPLPSFGVPPSFGVAPPSCAPPPCAVLPRLRCSSASLSPLSPAGAVALPPRARRRGAAPPVPAVPSRAVPFPSAPFSSASSRAFFSASACSAAARCASSARRSSSRRVFLRGDLPLNRFGFVLELTKRLGDELLLRD